MTFIVSKVKYDENGLWYADFDDEETTFIVEANDIDEVEEQYKDEYLIMEHSQLWL